MKEKRRGLGRGLGALIPTSPEGARPVDVFFPAATATIDPAERDDTLEVVDSPVDRTDSAGESLAGEDVDPSSADRDAEAPDMGEPVVRSAVVSDDANVLLSADGAAVAPAEGSVRVEPSIESELPAPGAATASADGSPTSLHESPSRPAETTSQADQPFVDSSGLVPVPGASFAEIPVGKIRPNSRQPRTVFDDGELDELIGSITEIGILQPIVVRPDPDEPGAYELIMGERRWRAAQAAGLEDVPAIIRLTDDEDMLRDALLENLHRSALNPLEEAAAYRQLLDDFGCTHDELASRISRSRPQISNTLRLLRLPPLVQRRVAAGVLSAGHARALLGLSDGAGIERLAQRIVSEGLSVRATEEIVALGDADDRPRRATPRAGQRIQAVDELATRLSDRFETRVRVDLGKAKGRVTIEFASVEDLNRILDVMAPEDPGLLRP